MQQLANQIKKNWMYYIFISFPFVNVLTGLNANFEFSPISAGMIFRALVLLIFAFYIMTCHSKYKKISLIYMGAVVVYAGIYLVLKIPNLDFRSLFDECKTMMKNFYFGIFLLGLMNYFDENPYDRKKWSKIFLLNLGAVLFFLIVPAVTGLGFPSYRLHYRGNIGWFYAGNEVGPILLLLFPIIFVFLRKQKLLFLFLALATAFSVKLVGTKVASLGFLLILAAYFVGFILLKDPKKKITSGLLILMAVLLSYILIFKVDYNYRYFDGKTSANFNDIFSEQQLSKDDKVPETTKENKTETTEKKPSKPKKQKKPKTTMQKMEHYFHVLLSGRDNQYKRMMRTYDNISPWETLFGLGYSQKDGKIVPFIEIDVLDHYFHNGIVGVILIYLPVVWLLGGYVVIFLKGKFLEQMPQIFSLFVILLIFGVSVFAGHIFTSTAVTTYYAFYFMTLSSGGTKFVLNGEKD